MRGKQFLYVLYQTTRASFLAQEKNSSLGLIWHLLNPILMTAVLFGVFSQMARLRNIEHYPLFILIGLIHYNFFVNTTSRSSNFFQASRSLILNTTVPLQILVLRQTCIEGLTLIVELMLVLVIGWFMGITLTSAVFAYPVVFLGMLLLSLGASLGLCGLAIFLADLNYVWGLFCRVLFFLTPILFSPEIAGRGIARMLVDHNPITLLVQLARQALLYGNPVSASEMAMALLGPAMVLLAGGLIFSATREKIADFI